MSSYVRSASSLFQLGKLRDGVDRYFTILPDEPQGLHQRAHNSEHHLGLLFDEAIVGCHGAPGILYFFAQIHDFFHALLEGG